jgi:hypothetical protein
VGVLHPARVREDRDGLRGYRRAAGLDTIAIGALVRVPGSDSAFIKKGETGIVIALENPYTGPCKRVTRAT